MTPLAWVRCGLASLVRALPVIVFLAVLAVHALYIRHVSAAPADVWADADVIPSSGPWGLGPYLLAQEYFQGFSYALGAAFSTWAIGQFVRTRRAAMAAGAAGSVTLVGLLMAAGCFLIGCCGSPMLGVYLALFGAKALGIGKPLMALVTFLSVSIGFFVLSRRFTRGNGADVSCCEGAVCLAATIPDNAAKVGTPEPCLPSSVTSRRRSRRITR